MQKRKLRNLEVSALGLGCMGMTMGHGLPKPKDEMIKFIKKAYEKGISFFDTAEAYIYKDESNESLVGEAIKGFREKIVLASKFGIYYENGKQVLNSHPKQIRKAVEGSLKRLKTDYIDLYYQHRVDTTVAIEEVAGVMKDLFNEGKIRAWGLSEAGIETIKRANAEFKLSAVQSEYSLWWREPESYFDELESLNIGFVPFSPLGKGFLTGAIKSANFGEGDFKGVVPRFSKENLEKNQILLNFLNEFARSKNISLAQLALGFILAKKDFLVPIFGTTKLERLDENLSALDVKFSEEELKDFNETLSKIEISGDRYPPELAARVGK